MAEFDSFDDARAYMRGSRNWGRFGENAHLGAAAMITPERRCRAAGLVTTGDTVSLARPAEAQWQTDDGERLASPSRVRTVPREGGGHAAVDRFAVACHGHGWTHLDGLGHVWDDEGMWEGRRPQDVIGTSGLSWGGIDVWSDGIVNRAVLLDVPRYRGEAFVDVDHPVHGSEFEEVARSQGVAVEPGDTLVVYSGRDAWERATGIAYGAGRGVRPSAESAQTTPPRPGLDISCLQFVRDADCALLVWDMMDALPSRLGLPWPMHSVLYLYGVGLVDNSYLEAAAVMCARNGRYEFMFVVAPLILAGGTGSPVNPLAIF